MKKSLLLSGVLFGSLYAVTIQNVDVLFKNKFEDNANNKITKNLSGFYRMSISDYFKKPDNTDIDQRRFIVNHLFVLKDSYKNLHGSVFFFYGNDKYNYSTKFYHELRNNVNSYSYRTGIKELYILGKINKVNVTIGKYIFDNSFSDIYSPQDIYKIYQMVSPSDYMIVGDWQAKFDYYTNNNTHITFDIFPFFNYTKSFSSNSRWSNTTSNTTSNITSNTTSNTTQTVTIGGQTFTLTPQTVQQIQQATGSTTIIIQADYNSHARTLFKMTNDNGYSKSLTIGYGPIYGQYSIFKDESGKFHAFNFNKLYVDLGLAKVIKNMKFYTEQYISKSMTTYDSNIYQYIFGMTYNVQNSKILKIGMNSLKFNLEFVNTNQFGLSVLNENVVQTSWDTLEPKKNINFKTTAKFGYKDTLVYFLQARLHKLQNNDQGVAQALYWKHNYNDHLILDSGLEIYKGKDASGYYQWRNNDRLKLSLKYTF